MNILLLMLFQIACIVALGLAVDHRVYGVHFSLGLVSTIVQVA